MKPASELKRDLATVSENIGMNFTDRTKQHRLRDRGSRDWKRIADILDAGFVAHVAFCINHQPFVIPTMANRVMAAVMNMKKLDLAQLEQA